MCGRVTISFSGRESNSGIKRALAQSEYEVRLKQCRAAVAKIAAAIRPVKSLRDVELADLDAARGVLDELLMRRARHVVSENERTLEAVKVLQGGDLERFGELMNQSHESLRDDYEVSSKELDTLVELARRIHCISRLGIVAEHRER